jgi:predicted acetyltransferase
MWETPELVKMKKEEAARKEAIQLAYKEWKEAQKAKDTAVSQIDDVEEAYRSWIQAKRDKEILM